METVQHEIARHHLWEAVFDLKSGQVKVEASYQVEDQNRRVLVQSIAARLNNIFRGICEVWRRAVSCLRIFLVAGDRQIEN